MRLSDLKGVGPSRLESLRAMGINSLRDLLYYLPIRYLDCVNIYRIADIQQETAMIQGVVDDRPKISYFHGISRVTATIRDGSGKLSLCWFNEPWMMQQLPVGESVMLYGKIAQKKQNRQMINPKIIREKGWIPVYKALRGIPVRTFHLMIREALLSVETICPETLPSSFRERKNLIDLHSALREAHFPDNLEKLKAARRRLSFENMLMYLMFVFSQRNQHQPGWSMDLSPEDTEFFWSRMPFSPTASQRRVLLEIAGDLSKNLSMSRLIQGDVGCGKTALAFGAIYLTWKAGFQSAMMAPTEILAHQHYENALKLLEPLGIKCRLLTGNTKAKERKEILNALHTGTCQAVFGTHALISADVEFCQLGLVITDEQHRFGVNQRSRLQEKGMNHAQMTNPHVIVMSATPIPRTLALILYGDLDLSIVDELPPGRKPVKTCLVPQEKRKDMYLFLRKQIAHGKQAYIVCPLVEDSETLDEVKSAKTLYKELCENELKNLSVGLTWGQQKSSEKAEILQKFTSGELNILVSTTVIEVGINVPSATVMIVENAERFGLSQLHQLRGRVGRGSDESWCFLMSEDNQKLKILCETNDGFAVAKKDLELRGPGDLTGTRQSGEFLQGFLLDGDTRMLDEAIQSVRELESDPMLKNEYLIIEKHTRDFFQEKQYKIALN